MSRIDVTWSYRQPAQVRIRAAKKRHLPHMTRNWIVTHHWTMGRFSHMDGQTYVYNAQRRERIYVCETFAKAVALADAIVRDEVVDARLVMDLSERWAR